jgi:phenylacetate-CoA ligase
MLGADVDEAAGIRRVRPAHPGAAGPLLRCGRAVGALSHSRELSRDRLEAYQSVQLRRLVEHAYEHVPYYRQLFDRHGVAPRHIRGIADLVRIPVTTRSELQRAAPEELVPRGLDPGSLLASTTSGSSGRPLTIRRSWLENSTLYLYRLRGFRRMGLRLRDHLATLVRVKLRLPGDHKTVGAIFRSAGLLRRSRIDLLSEPETIAAQLSALQPDAVQGFPSTLVRVAEVLAARGQPPVWPRLIVAGGEVLTPPARRAIAEGFGASVIEEYGCHELNQIAWQCPAGGVFHTADDAMIVEVRTALGDAAPGESGEVVATALHQYAMPLIRYALGDLAVRAPFGCACGSAFASLAAIEGRTLDLFTLPGGRVLHPFKVLYSFVNEGASSWMGCYQLLQTREDRVELRIVPNRPPTQEQLAQLRRSVGAALGDDVELEIGLVADLPPDPNGKFRPCRSLVTAR